MRLPVIKLPSLFVNQRLRVCVWVAVAVVLMPILVALAARFGMWAAARGRVYNDVAAIPNCRVALVLGCEVMPDGGLSVLLRDRVDTAINLYKAHKVEKLLMSGDNRFLNYNEPEGMKAYAVKHGVPAEDITCDYAGRRTYDSMYRARHIFGITQMIVVTQRFHLDRSIFLCEYIGIDAYGMTSDRPGHWNIRPVIREAFASVAALLDVYLLRPLPVMGKRETI